MKDALVTGYVGRDPNFSKKGKVPFAAFSVCARNPRNKEDELWVNVKAFGGSAEFVNEYIKKGQAVYVQGNIELDMYEDEPQISITASTIQLMGGDDMAPKKGSKKDKFAKSKKKSREIEPEEDEDEEEEEEETPKKKSKKSKPEKKSKKSRHDEDEDEEDDGDDDGDEDDDGDF